MLVTGDLETLMGRDPISIAMACVHDYVLVRTGWVICSKCELKTTVRTLWRAGIPFRKAD